MAEQKMIYVETIRTTPFMSIEDISKEWNFHKDTVRTRVKEIIENSGPGKRYEHCLAVIGEGKSIRINNLAFTDWLSVKGQMKNKNAAKYLEPYDPAKVARSMGWSNRYVATGG